MSSSEVGRQYAGARSGRAMSRWLPPPALLGFVLLLVVMFGLSYAVGRAVGPVAPAMHGTGAGSGSGGGDGGGMGGMDMDHGSGG
ncbi:hypothetical protein [Streptomyces kunmingensis]